LHEFELIAICCKNLSGVEYKNNLATNLPLSADRRQEFSRIRILARMIFLRKSKKKERKIGGCTEKEALPLLRDVNHTPEKCVRLLKERFPMLEDYLLLPDDPLLMINDCVRLLRDGFIEEDDNRLVVNDWVLLMKEREVVL